MTSTDQISSRCSCRQKRQNATRTNGIKRRFSFFFLFTTFSTKYILQLTYVEFNPTTTKNFDCFGYALYKIILSIFCENDKSLLTLLPSLSLPNEFFFLLQFFIHNSFSFPRPNAYCLLSSFSQYSHLNLTIFA